MKYKVGDKVKVKSREWYYKNKDKYGCVEFNNIISFIKQMTKYCGRDVVITDANDAYYTIDVDSKNTFMWTDDMFED